MHIENSLPHNVRETEHLMIELPDGTKLAAKLWLPEGAERERVPAILEFIPYRKRDCTAERDASNHRWFAGHGYACLRVDMRGSGESNGVLLDEYIEQEQRDGIEIIDWIRRQSWSDGQVGMFGISWGGFNGLQIAAKQPKGLKAVITAASTDDRYADDVHYMGGCLLGDNLSWASTMFAYNASPPDPALVGDIWRELWLQRLNKSGLWVKNWLEHQWRDDFWKQGSICEDFSKIKVPVFAVSGWADGYSNAVFRMVKNLQSPTLGLIGPWSHKYPHFGVPGPAIGFLQECLRFWDYWLKGKETGIMDEPKLRTWMQNSVSPSCYYDDRPGRWVGEDEWPSRNVKEKLFRLAPSLKLLPSEDYPSGRQNDSWVTIQSPISVGQYAGKWCSYAATPDLPGDQREEDGGSLIWQSDPLEEPLDLLGQVQVNLLLRSNRPTGMVAVRLSDVSEDGKATRVTYGLLNLTHYRSHEHPEPIEPDKDYKITVKLNDCAHRFNKDQRVRISLSSSMWPLAWLPAEPTALTINMEQSEVILPTRKARFEDEKIQFSEPTKACSIKTTQLENGDSYWRLERDLGSDQSTMRVMKDDGKKRFDDIDLILKKCAYEEYGFKNDNFHSVFGTTVHKRTWARGEWKASFSARTLMKSDAEFFYIEADLDAWEGDRRIFSKSWYEKIPRQLV